MGEMIQRTLVFLKPDAVQRSLTGEILSRFERKGLKIIAAKMMHISKGKAARFYAVHKGKRFYDKLVSYISSGPILAFVLEGKNAIRVVREMMGTTDPQKAATGTIRGDYGLDIGRNVIHGSDTKSSAKAEIQLIFEDDEIFEYTRIDEKWLYEYSMLQARGRVRSDK